MKKILTIITLLIINIHMPTFAQIYTIGSYNIRADIPQDAKSGNAWKDRYNALCNLISFNDFDIFGTQEDPLNQIRDIQTKLSDTYNYTGIARDDGISKGELCAIFYKKETFDLIASCTFWLSETPEKISKGWDAKGPRICTFARLKDKKNGSIFSIFNLHIDHLGIKARTNSCKLVIEKINKLCQKNDTIILVGDFNFTEISANFQILVNSKYFKDCYKHAKRKWIPTGSCCGFTPNNISKHSLDHILVSKNTEVNKFGVLNNFYFTVGKNHISEITQTDKMDLKNEVIEIHNPSDHYPICAEITIRCN